MNLYIMSRGRAGNVRTLDSISPAVREKTYLVVGKNEVNDYLQCYPLVQILGAPEFVTNYSQKFQYILDGLPLNGEDLGCHIERKAVILDDDLVFSRFNEYGSLRTERDPHKLDGMWSEVEWLLETYALVGVHARQNANSLWGHGPYNKNERIICMQGINREIIGKVKVDQYPILADVVLNCTLLARGEANAVITDYCQDHGPCQAPGGCSIYRTPEMQEAAVDYLVRRFPGYVKKVERRPKVARWMGDVRYDYSCQWKKLYTAGRAFADGVRPSPDLEVLAANDNTGDGQSVAG